MITNPYFVVNRLGAQLARGVLVLTMGTLASLPAGAAPWGPAPIPQTPVDWLKNCLIYTTNGVDVPGPFEIFGDPESSGFLPYRSDVCSTGVADIGGNAQRARVPVQAPDLVDVAVIAPTINLNRGSMTSECDYDTAAGGSLNVASDAVRVCPVQRNVNLSSMPADITTVLPFPVITPGATNIEVATGQTYTLPGPGQYGRVLLNPSSELVFPSPGNYQFLSIETRTAETRADIIVKVPGVNIMVKEYMFLGHRSRVNEADTRLLKVFVEGTDGVIIEGLPRAAFTFRGDAFFNACYVYSPNGTQSWRGKPLNDGAYKTQSFGLDFFEDTTTAKFRVTMAHPQDEQCFNGGPLPEVRCDYKTFSPSSLSDQDGVVNAEVKISNVGQVAANVVIIRDTMSGKMTYRPGTSNIGDPAGGPPTYTFPGQSISANNFLILTYQVDINGLNVNEQVCNNVQITANGTTDQCRACVTRTEPPVSVPAVGLWGLSVLVAVFAGIGGLLGYSRRKGGFMR